MNGLTIVAMGHALPSSCVTNHALSQYVDTSDAWIRSRTGIQQRYFCGEGETTTTLAITAARNAMEQSGVSAAQIGCVVCATISSNIATPSIACQLQSVLGLSESIPTLDVNAACSGFLYGVAVAQGLLAVTSAQNPNAPIYALVVGVEALSNLLDMHDRNTCVLFGDGAGAAVLQASATSTREYTVTMGSRGSDAIFCGGVGHETRSIQMDGKAVFRFAVDVLPQTVQEILTMANLTLEEIDWVVCHQANERIIDHCVKKLHADSRKFYKNMSRVGNTSAASIPLALSEMQEKGLLLAGQRVLCVGFGGGLSWAGALLTIKKGGANETAIE